MSYNNIYKNLNDMFQKRVEENPTATAIRTKKNNRWEEISRVEYYETSKNVGMALKELGVKAKDKVAILSNTCVEWVYADMGILGINAITVSLYQSALIEEIEYILKDSEASFLFIEDNIQLEKIKTIKDKLPNIKKVVIFSGDTQNLDWLISFDEFLEIGKKYDVEEFKSLARDIDSNETAAIIYTSGTTGKPKGAIISHLGFMANSQGLSDSLPSLHEGSETFIFLPLAHVFAKIVHLLTIYKGMVASYAESIEKILDNIYETNPDFIGSVPRIYEKIYTKIISKVEAEGGIKAKMFYWSLDIGKKVSKLKLKEKPIPYALALQYKLADKLVFSKLREKFGKNFKFFVSAGAPLSEDIAQFFHAADIKVLEAYGLTEISGAVTMNPENKIKFGTVGKPYELAEIKLAEDGEILCKGPILMKGYYNRPEESAEVLKDGWFYTGDIGEFDEDGYLKITDRKKDIIVTAAGKNVAPQYIANAAKTSRYINQIIVLGDQKKYLVAILNVDYEQVEEYAKKNNIIYNNFEELAGKSEIFELINNEIKLINENLPSYATIKYFKIIAKEFSIESGELTPSLKVKRKFCMEKYKDLIESMYE